MLTLSCSQAGTDQRVTDRDPAHCHEETTKQGRGDGQKFVNIYQKFKCEAKHGSS